MARFKDSFYLKRQRTILLLACAIDYLDGKITKEQCDKKQARIWQAWKTFADVVEMARLYILTDCNGSFERFAEWGLVRPLAQV